MMSACAAPPESYGLIGWMTRFVDCQAEQLGSRAYHALASPGSTLSVVITGFLMIFIAIIGYRLLLGEGPSLRSGTLAMVKLGAVLALATSWPAYQTLVYNVVTQGPEEIVEEIGGPAGLPGSDGTLVRRLDLADGALLQLAIYGVGDSMAAIQEARVPPPPFGGFNAFALGTSRILFLLTAIAGLAAVRLVAGLMLALGPFFIAFLLFDNTRSLFEGWVRVLGGAAVGAIGVSVALGVELALLEPWLAAMLARRAAGETLPWLPTELVVVTSLFALLVLAALVASIRLMQAFRLAPIFALPGGRTATVEPARAQQGLQAVRAASPAEERTRAAAVADVLVAMQRRESIGALTARPMVTAGAAMMSHHSHETRRGRTEPIGRSFRRRAQRRPTGSADRRDKI